MTRLYSIFVDSDFYEVLLREDTITRVIRYSGDSQLRREIAFFDLPSHVRERILTEITNG